MKRQTIYKWAALAGLLALAACAPSQYRVKVASRLGRADGALMPGARVAVVGNPMARSQLRDEVIGAKIAYLLKERNFRLSNRSRARYALSYEYSAQHRVYGYGGGSRIAIGLGFGPRHYWRPYDYDYPYHHDYADYQDYYRHTVNLKLIDLKTAQVAWAGRAYLDSFQESDDGLLDYLLVALFEDFGSQAPPGPKVVAVDDPRVLALRTVTP